MKLLTKGYLLVFFVFLSLLFLQCGDSKNVIAEVEDQEITSEYFRTILENKFKTWDLSKISYEDKRKTLDQLIDKRLKYLKAADLGLDKDPEFEQIIQKQENKIIVEKLYQDVIVGQFISEDLLKKYFEWQKYEVSVQLILLEFQGIYGYQGNRTKQKTENLLIEIFDKIKSKKDFEEILFEYSDDPTKGQSQGVLKPYPIGLFSPETDEAVFISKVDELIGPFLTPRGFAIFKILEKKEIEIKTTYGYDKKEIKRKLFSSYFVNPADKKYRKTNLKYYQKYKPEYNEGNINKFFSFFVKKMRSTSQKDLNINSEQRSIILASLNNQPVSAGELVDYYFEQLYQNYPRVNSIIQFKNLIRTFLEYQSWVCEARSQNISQSMEIQNQLEEIRINELVKIFETKEISETIQIDEDEIIAYYQDNKSKFMEPERIEIWVIAVKDEELAKNLELRAGKGENFEELAKKYTEKLAYKSIGGRMGFQKKNSRFGVIVDKAFEAGSEKIAGPFKDGNFYNILKTGKYIPAQQKEIETVKTQIKFELRQKKKEKKNQELIEQMRQEYFYKINESVFRRLT